MGADVAGLRLGASGGMVNDGVGIDKTGAAVELGFTLGADVGLLGGMVLGVEESIGGACEGLIDGALIVVGGTTVGKSENGAAVVG